MNGPTRWLTRVLAERALDSCKRGSEAYRVASANYDCVDRLWIEWRLRATEDERERAINDGEAALASM